MLRKLENMDEMLDQFSGQEEELIVTLNTMNEATLSTANERQWASSSGRTSASGSGREGSGVAAVAELGALGSSAVPRGGGCKRARAPWTGGRLPPPRGRFRCCPFQSQHQSNLLHQLVACDLANLLLL